MVAVCHRATVIGSVWELLFVGLVLASGVMAVLLYVQTRIGDASLVDVAWAALIACTAILYALLADGDTGHFGQKESTVAVRHGQRPAPPWLERGEFHGPVEQRAERPAPPPERPARQPYSRSAEAVGALPAQAPARAG